MLSLKPGVKIDKLQPQMALALVVAHDVYRELGASCTITSGNDGEHMDGSLHYEGFAVDLRTRDLLPVNKGIVVERLKTRLGSEFDVVMEADHLHLEYDPRKGA
jgi:Hedgehog amino-terminal signalling domain